MLLPICRCLAVALLCAVATTLTAADAGLDQPSQDYLRMKAELEALVAERDTEVYELDFHPIKMDRILMEERHGPVHVYHYLMFRVRNRVSDNARFLAEHASRFREIMAGIAQEYEGLSFQTDGGARLVDESATSIEDQRLRTIVEREDLNVRSRRVNITAVITDENGTRFRLFDEVPGEGPQEKFDYQDLGETRYGVAYHRVREAIEDKEGQRLLSVHELRTKELSPYDASVRDEEGVAQGEAYGILIFNRLPTTGDFFTVHVQGLSNKLRFRVPEHGQDEVADYFNTRILRRTMVCRYARIGDEYFLDTAPFKLLESGWRWEQAFVRLHHRRTMAYARYHLDNIALAIEPGAPERTEGQTIYLDGKDKKDIQVPVLHDAEVAQRFWEHYRQARETVAQRLEGKKGAADATAEEAKQDYQALIEEAPLSEEQLRARQQADLAALEQRKQQLEESLRALPERMPEIEPKDGAR